MEFDITLERIKQLIKEYPDPRIWDYLEQAQNDPALVEAANTMIAFAAEGFGDLLWDDESNQPMILPKRGIKQ